MRTIILIMFLFIPMGLLGQIKDSVEYFENYFREYSLQTSINGKQYIPNDLDKAVDAQIEFVFKSPLPNKNFRYFDWYYGRDSIFTSIIDATDKLGKTNKDFCSPLANITLSQIYSIEPLGKRECLLLNFIDHFKDADSASKYYAHRNVALNRKKFWEIEKKPHKYYGQLGLNCEIDGDYSLLAGKKTLSFELLHYALYLYKKSGDFYAEGIVNRKIASFYAEENFYFGWTLAVEHYDEAIKCFDKCHILQEVRSCQMARNSVILKMLKSGGERDILTDIGLVTMDNLEKGKKSFTLSTIDSTIQSNSESDNYQNKLNLLKDAYYASFHINEYDRWGSRNTNLFYFLGEYFWGKNELIQTKKYFELGVITTTLNQPLGYDEIAYANALSRLAWVYSDLGDYYTAVKYIDRAIDFSFKAGDNGQRCWLYAIKGDYYTNLGRYSDAISWLGHAQDSLRANDLLGDQRDAFREYVCAAEIRVLKALHDTDKANYYAGISNDLRLTDIDRLYKFGQIEKTFEQESFSEQKDELMNELTKISGTVEDLTDEKLRLKVNIDSMVLSQRDLDSSIREKNTKITKLDDSIQEKEKKIEKISLVAIIVTCSLLSCLSLAIFIAFLKNQKVKKVRHDSNSLAAASAHNIANNYTTMYLMTLNNNPKSADYAGASNDYYASVINWEDLENDTWTLGNELAVLRAFANREKIEKDNFDLNIEENSLPVGKIHFVPEVFTELLKNSIKYGFKDVSKKNTKYYFTINIKKQGEYLYFEASDNGTFAGADNYFIEDTPNSGLTFLKNRICNELNSRWRLKRPDDFVVKENKDHGTTIKFRFPCNFR